MTDRQLLELAAKAAGLKVHTRNQAERDALIDPTTASLWIVNGSTAWNPLTNDDDAFALAVALEMVVDFRQHGDDLQHRIAGAYGAGICHDAADPRAASRRAIVLAAAA